MATDIPKLDYYKLETEFHDDYVVHTTYEWRYSTKRLKYQLTWENQKKIGAGGFGSVWLEKEKQNGQLRAVKRLDRGRLPETAFSRELLALIKLKDHEHLFVNFLGWYEDRNMTYLAMEYVEYGDLSQYIEGGQGRAKAQEITRQILEGLEVLHGKGICHRDLKPQNVLIASPDPIWVKIADFGASKRTKGTILRTQIGTVGYTAPELQGALPRKHRECEELTHALDVWSLGCLVHELLTSETPFLEDESCEIRDTGSSMEWEPQIDMNVFFAYCSGTINFPTEVLQKSGISEEAISFVKSLLAAIPAARPTATEALRIPWLARDRYRDEWYEGLEREFSVLEPGVMLGLRDKEKGIMIRKRYRADIMQFLPLSAQNRFPALLQQAVTKGLNIASLMLIESQSSKSINYSVWAQLLHQVIENRLFDTMKLLLANKVDIDALFDNRTALQVMSERGDIDMVKTLLENKANINLGVPTPLQCAVDTKNMGMALLLLDSGAEIDTTIAVLRFRRAMKLAIKEGNIAMVKLLLDNQVDNARRWECRKILQAMLESGSFNVARNFLEGKLTGNTETVAEDGWTTLQMAAAEGDVNMVLLMLDYGAEINARGAARRGRTALQAAAGRGFIDVARLLLTKGADINALGCENMGRTALQAAAEGGHIDMAKLLLDRNADVNAEGSGDGGRTALQAAAEGGHIDMAKLLLDRNADVNAEGSGGGGRTALQAAAAGGHIDMAKLFLDHKADVNTEEYRFGGRTTLQAAKEGGHFNIVRLLTEAGVR